MTIQEAKLKAIEKLKTKSPTPELDSRVILSEVLKLSQSQLIINYKLQLSSSQEKTFFTLIEQRENHVPIAYLIGKKEFYSRDFFVNEHTLIPRPDTEILVFKALEYIKSKTDKTKELSILDLCTGTGCIGLSLAAEAEQQFKLSLTLTDIDENALLIAKKNSHFIKKTPLFFKKSDLFTNLINEKYDIITANPPYLTQNWIDDLEDDVKLEPTLALYGHSKDGLGLINQLLDNAANHLNSDSAVFIECDFRQVQLVKQKFLEKGFYSVKIEKDLNGYDRVVWAKYA